MSNIIDLRADDDPRDAIHRAVERLAAGEAVGLPTETDYAFVALAVRPEAVAKVRSAFGPLALLVRSAEEALDYAPGASDEAERLFRRLWPGPVVFDVALGGEPGLTAALPDATREAVTVGGRLRLRVSAHEVVAAVRYLVPAPLVVPIDVGAGSAAALLDRHGPLGGLLLEDGPPPLPGRPTVVAIDGSDWRVAEAGVLDEPTIRDRASLGVVFVCTGNTCRSPLAEAIFRKLLAERLDCPEDELPSRGVLTASAGLSATYGLPAAAESLSLAEEFGLTLDRHRSRPLTDDLLDRADYVFAMTNGHRESILSVRPDLAGRVHLLSREGLDIADPIGGGPAEYERCRSEIERELLAVLEHLPLPKGPARD